MDWGFLRTRAGSGPGSLRAEAGPEGPAFPMLEGVQAGEKRGRSGALLLRRFPGRILPAAARQEAARDGRMPAPELRAGEDAEGKEIQPGNRFRGLIFLILPV